MKGHDKPMNRLGLFNLFLWTPLSIVLILMPDEKANDIGYILAVISWITLLGLVFTWNAKQ